MRRAFVVLAAVSMMAAFATPAWAEGGQEPGIEEYDTQSLNGFWYTKRNISGNVYRLTTWYAGVYQTNEEFWSDLYRATERCERRPGRDRCTSLAYEVGVINDVAGGGFGVHESISSGWLDATYELRKYGTNGRRAVSRRTVRFVGFLDAIGELRLSTEHYESWIGDCLEFEYSAEYSGRQSDAWGSIDGKSIGWTDDAYLSQGHVIYEYYDCEGSDGVKPTDRAEFRFGLLPTPRGVAWPGTGDDGNE